MSVETPGYPHFPIHYYLFHIFPNDSVMVFLSLGKNLLWDGRCDAVISQGLARVTTYINMSTSAT